MHSEYRKRRYRVPGKRGVASNQGRTWCEYRWRWMEVQVEVAENELGISQGPVSGRDGILQHPVHLALNIYLLLRYVSNRFVTGSTSNRL